MSAQAVLFDAPGPKARRRHAILTVLGLLAAALVPSLAPPARPGGTFPTSAGQSRFSII